MKPEQIKINNWFTHYADWSYRQPDSGPFKEFDFKWEERDWLAVGESCLELERIKPIKLTEEWLIRLPDDEWKFVGFGNRQIWQHIKFRAIKFEYAQGQVFVYFNDEMINVKDYFHELQNLFHALTGSELEIKD